MYSEWYKIEKQNKNNWIEVDTIIDDYEFNELGYIPDSNNEVKFTVDWKWLYGELPLGNYRLLKQVDSKYISVQFSLKTTQQ